MNFESTIRQWYYENKRSLPWRSTLNPYHIWLSEIIMQQTRIAQGLAYYERFATQYPTVKDLARANIDAVMKLWEGLGYYSRARNLHAAAQLIAFDLNGVFPNNYNDLLKIKGIGPYTAAAISSICFDENRAVLDGNVFRVLSRIHGIETPINSSEGKKRFGLLASELIQNSAKPGDYNQAIMEFGALQCKPKNPSCGHCLFNSECSAFSTGRVSALPKKDKLKPRQKRHFNYFIIQEGDKIAVEKRTEKDIWSGLYQFPLLESETYQTKHIGLTEKPIKHILTHQHLQIAFYSIKKSDYKGNSELVWVKNDELINLAFPIVLARFIESNLLHLRHRLA